MREKPILFSGPMVRAILDGAKTQTRRLVKPQPDVRLGPFAPVKPFARVGDTLWVKETWRTLSAFDGSSPQSVGEQSGVPHARAAGPVMYDADGAHNDEWARWLRSPLAAAAKPGKTRVSIHMPRWASRLTLRVTGVRIERLCAISEEDALAEGAMHWLASSHPDRPPHPATPRSAFALLWLAVHGDGAWERDRDRWVWVCGFEVVR